MRRLGSLVVVALLVACAREPLSLDPGSHDAPSTTPRSPISIGADATRGDVHIAVLWHTGCDACSFRSEDPKPPDAVLQEQADRLVLQPVSVVGEFPTSFNLQFDEPPPSSILNTWDGYPTGALVITELDGEVDFERLPAENVVMSFPLLFDRERAALRILSEMPIYAAFATAAGEQTDQNVTGNQNEGGPLAPGFHVARHDGVALKTSIATVLCLQTAPPGHESQCGNDTFSFAGVHEVGIGDRMSVVPGGPEELSDVLRGFTADELGL